MQNCKLIAIFNAYCYVYEMTADEKDGDEKYGTIRLVTIYKDDLERHGKDINDNVDDDRSNNIVKEKEFPADSKSTFIYNKRR